MKHLNLVIVLFSFILCETSSVHAAPVWLQQEWRDPLFASNGQSLVTNSFYDDTALTNVGIEQILLDNFSVLRLLSGVGQNFSVGDFSDPPSLSVGGNAYAQYNDGVFQFMTGTDDGSTGTVLLREGSLSGPVSGRAAVGASSIVYLFPVSGKNEYFLHSSTFISQVPLPAAAWLFGSGLIGLIGIARRGKTRIKE